VLVEHLASDHVTIILPDIHADDMQWLLDFMYTGAVAVPRCRLSSFLQAAEALHIKVLTDVAQLQKGAESDSVVCIPASSPALDIKLRNLPNFQNHIANSNIDPCCINPYDLTEDVKYSTCNEDSKLSTDSSKLMSNKQGFAAVTVDRGCVLKCSVDNSTYPQNILQNPAENNINSYKVLLNNTSQRHGSSTRNKAEEAKSGDYSKGELSSGKGVELVSSGRYTRFTQNSVAGNEMSFQHSPENVVLPYQEKPVRDKSLWKPLHDKSLCDNKAVAGNINSDHSGTPSSANRSGTSSKMSPANRIYNKDRRAPCEGESSSEYGLKFSSSSDLHIIHKGNSNRIIPNSICSEYTQEELPLRNEDRNYQQQNIEHYALYEQRLSQWPKPIPSLMPISPNCNYNGDISPGCLSKDDKLNGLIAPTTRSEARKPETPQPLQNVKDFLPNIGQEHLTDSTTINEDYWRGDRRVKSLWLSARDKEMQLSGHRRPSRSLAQNMPRLSPIVPPSPWSQHHRPPCATPVALPPRGTIGFNYHAVGWFTPRQTLSPVQRFVNHGGGERVTAPHLQPPDLHLTLGDAVRLHPSAQVRTLVSNNALH
jgi:hypothetical protein